MTSSVLATLRRNGGLWFQSLFVLGAVLSAAATFILLDRSSPTAEMPQELETLLIVNVVILIVLAWMIVSRYLTIRRSRRVIGGGRLTRRFMLLFGTVAMMPAVIMSLFLWLTITRGIDTWFGETVLTLVDEIATITEESGEAFSRRFELDALAVANDLDASVETFQSNPEQFEPIFGIVATYRDFSSALLIDRAGNPIAIAENMSAPNTFGRPAP
ncbi:MAG: hypothetical protein AAF767_05490, partial [Pseudomonadota bacterium]